MPRPFVTIHAAISPREPGQFGEHTPPDILLTATTADGCAWYSWIDREWHPLPAVPTPAEAAGNAVAELEARR